MDVTSLSTALADTSARAFAGGVHTIDRRTAAVVALGLVAAFITGGGGGWWTGITTAQVAIVET